MRAEHACSQPAELANRDPPCTVGTMRAMPIDEFREERKTPESLLTAVIERLGADALSA